MSEIICQSRICSVAVYARGAEITREVSLPAEMPSGPIDLVVGGISVQADSGSFRAFLVGSRQLVGVKSQLHLPSSVVAVGPLAERLRLLEVEQARLSSSRAALVRRRQSLQGVSLRAVDGGLRSRRSVASSLQDLTQGNKLLRSKLEEIDRQIAALDAQQLESEKARAAAMLEAQQSSPSALSGENRALRSATIRLQGEGEVTSLLLVYTVASARWWPAYSARLSANATRAAISVEAFIAQSSGEDWSGVSLSLCTADLILDARLPELPSLRLGKAQPKIKRGFREPPPGLDELFRSYDQALSPASPPTHSLPREEAARPKAKPQKQMTTESEDDASELFSLALASRDKTVVPERAADLPTDMLYERAKKRESSAPHTLSGVFDAEMAPPKSASVGNLVGGLVGGIVGGVAAAFGAKADEGGRGGGGSRMQEEAEPDLSDAWLDFDALILVSATGRRGRLTRSPEVQGASGAAELEQLAAPYLTRDPRESRGHFDHRYTAQGTREIIANGKIQRVHLLTVEAPSAPLLRAVPREASEVYREASVKNPFDAPLLSGPVDIFLDGALLTTATLSAVDKGGYLSLGLGVEERIRVARNARVEESSTGLLSGKTHIDHHVSIDLTSSLGYPTRIEILDRIPVSDDKSAEVVLHHAVPASQWYDQSEKGRPIRGGLLWNIDLPAAGKVKIDFSYRINLPAKNEIVGGNRRE